MQGGRLDVGGLARCTHEPVHEQLRRFLVRCLIHRAVDRGRDDFSLGRENELDRRALGLVLQVAGILAVLDHHVLTADGAVELLDVGIERARVQLGEFGPIVLTEDTPHQIPHLVLRPGVGDLDVDRVLPSGVGQIGPAFRCVLGLHRGRVIGDAGNDRSAPHILAFRRAFIFRLVGAGFRGNVLHPALPLLEIQREGHVRQHQNIGCVGLGLPFRHQLGIERTGLQPQVIRFDFRKRRLERRHQRRLVGFRIGRIHHDGAFGLGLRHVGAGFEPVHLARFGTGRGPHRGGEQQSRGNGNPTHDHSPFAQAAAPPPAMRPKVTPATSPVPLP